MKRNKPIQQHAFRLEDTKLITLHFYNPSASMGKRANLGLKVEYDIQFNPENNREFRVVYKVDVEIADKRPGIKTIINSLFAAIFSTEKEIDDDFRNSDFVNLNAPAIGFPYLRSLITTITANAGISPIILPTINFSKIKKSNFNEAAKEIKSPD